MGIPSRRGDVHLADPIEQLRKKPVLAVACLALIVLVLRLTASSGGQDVVPVGDSAKYDVAALNSGPQEATLDSSDDVARVGVYLPIFDKIDDAVHIQGNALLTHPYRLDGELSRVRVLVVALDAVVPSLVSLTSHLLGATLKMEQVDCSSTAAISAYFQVELDGLPPDGLSQFAEATLADPHKRYSLHLRPRDDLTWGQVSVADQLELVLKNED
jgi:hypothetical protein